MAVVPDLDPLLLSQIRLGAVSVLMTRPSATFGELKELLEVTQGNLGTHLRKLEDAKYVSAKKEFVERRPRTTYRLTATGRRAFMRHLQMLERVAQQAVPKTTTKGTRRSD